MRLINARTLKLEDFTLKTIPPYAILSHTWGEGEVSFQDMSFPSPSSKKGCGKIRNTCKMALVDGLEFAWVDTCCINKDSSAELTESINSMFKWYRDAAICYVFLEDVVQGPDTVAVEEQFMNSRWFTRGWTLQELIAPKKLEFFDSTWKHMQSKKYHVDAISTMTKIPRTILRLQEPVTHYSVATRMSWAAQRKTTRVEDMGYCLLGLFDVNMPLIYGEGTKAFRRLQEEIVKNQTDLTVFAWQQEPHSQYPLGLFAPSPLQFAQSSGIKPFGNNFMEYTVTNSGLRVVGDKPLIITTVKEADGTKTQQYIMSLGLSSLTKQYGGICLRRLGPRHFCRNFDVPLLGFDNNLILEESYHIYEINSYYIFIDHKPSDLVRTSDRFRVRALHIPSQKPFRLISAAPEDLWDVKDSLFLRPKPYDWAPSATVLAAVFDCRIEQEIVRLLVLCDCREPSKDPTFRVDQLLKFGPNELKRLVHGFKASTANHFLSTPPTEWPQLENDAPYIFKMKNFVDIGRHRVTVSCEKGFVKEISKNKELYILQLDLSEISRGFIQGLKR